jgi:hypothetical protein
MSQEEKIKIGKQLDEAISKYDSLILDKILDGAQKNKPPYKITEVDYLKLFEIIEEVMIDAGYGKCDNTCETKVALSRAPHRSD